jgi:hypothetical protein
MKLSRSKLEQDLRRQITLGKRLLVLGILLMLVGTFFFVKTQRYYVSASRASGKIVEIEKQQHQKDVTYYPVFSFVDSVGTTHVIHTSQTRTWSGWNRFYKVGDTVEVLYPAHEPEKARLNNLFSVWGWVLVFGGIGLIFVIVGIEFWYSAATYPVDKLASPKDQWAEPN